MWNYQRKLIYPIKITKPNPELAKIIIAQYGGADGNCLSKSITSKTHI